MNFGIFAINTLVKTKNGNGKVVESTKNGWHTIDIGGKIDPKKYRTSELVEIFSFSPRRVSNRTRNPSRVSNHPRSPMRVSNRTRSPRRVANLSKGPKYIVFCWTKYKREWQYSAICDANTLEEVVDCIKQKKGKHIFAVINEEVLNHKYTNFADKYNYINQNILMVDNILGPDEDIIDDSYRCGKDTYVKDVKDVLVAAGTAKHCIHYLKKVIKNGGNPVEDDY